MKFLYEIRIKSYLYLYEQQKSYAIFDFNFTQMDFN